MAALAAVVALAALLVPSPAIAASLLETPMMGWSSWNTFECKISEGLIRESAQAMVDRGFLAAGYNYVNIDDCWAAATREPAKPGANKLGPIQWDPVTFPSGPALASEIHGRGFKLGIYSSAGIGTCAGRTGSLWHEDEDAAKFAEWGVDFLKYDNCDEPTPDGWTFPLPPNNGIGPEERFGRMGRALRDVANSTGKHIVYGMCAWGFYKEWEWASEKVLASKWRIQEDIGFCWDYPCRKMPVLAIWDRLASLPASGADYASPTRGFNDLDMLAVGVPTTSMTLTEERSHFSMWAVVKSPLVLGCDVRTVDEARRTLLTNAEVIAVNQDPLGQPARRVFSEGGVEIWAGALSGNAAVAMLLNRNDGPAAVTLDFAAHLSQIPTGFARSAGDEYRLRDLWQFRDLGLVKGRYQATVEPHGVAVLRISQPGGQTAPVSSAASNATASAVRPSTASAIRTTTVPAAASTSATLAIVSATTGAPAASTTQAAAPTSAPSGAGRVAAAVGGMFAAVAAIAAVVA
ncbi:alpha-galactosidase [Hyaloraphidium curvatum]|nr:alpha-galactosidase [Hyaloraphidium curvatum]